MLVRALAARAACWLRPALAQRHAPVALALLSRSPLPAAGRLLSTAATGGEELLPEPIEELLDQWVASKRARNFVLADDLRDQLRKLGVNPQHARPDPRTIMKEGQRRNEPLDAATEAKLDEWVAAKVAVLSQMSQRVVP